MTVQPRKQKNEKIDHAVLAIKDTMTHTGYRVMKGALWARCHKVQYSRVQASMHQVEIEGVVLQMTQMSFIVRQTYSIMQLGCANNNNASTDHGVENVDIARLMFTVRGVNRTGFGWDNHPFFTERLLTPNQLRTLGERHHPVEQPDVLTALSDSQLPDVLEPATGTHVPKLECPLNEEELTQLDPPHHVEKTFK
ncbi:hypothetical protein Q5P01_013146 [Channa striata]|uniref:Uncharacterized protein n=1 Tax=Channa striata TaxID=64152 RepID=A0AA88MK17_CHASR|nr:hypothetical protein Q5P01_013146 [Channa striata]